MGSVKNLVKVMVSTGYDDDDTEIVLNAGDGAKLPDPPFNMVWWNATDYADPSEDPNVEIVRVTAVATDTLTITRGEESIAATTKNTADKVYRMILTVTKKTIDDLIASMFVIEAPTGDVDDANVEFVFTAKPKAVVVNGSMYREDHGWSWSAPTATLDAPVMTGGDIYGIM